MARTSLDCALHGGTLRTQCWFGAICLDTAVRSEFQKSLYGDRTLRGGRLAEKAGRKKKRRRDHVRAIIDDSSCSYGVPEQKKKASLCGVPHNLLDMKTSRGVYWLASSLISKTSKKDRLRNFPKRIFRLWPVQ